jgi:hypothetical protein
MFCSRPVNGTQPEREANMKSNWSRWAGCIALVAACAVAPPAQAGDTCKDVTIKLTNKLDVKIMIANFQWYDYDKERWHDPIDISFEKQVIDPNGVKTYLKNLAGVKKDKTKIKVKYWKAKKNVLDRWDEGFEVIGQPHACQDGEINEISIQ